MNFFIRFSLQELKRYNTDSNSIKIVEKEIERIKNIISVKQSDYLVPNSRNISNNQENKK